MQPQAGDTSSIQAWALQRVEPSSLQQYLQQPAMHTSAAAKSSCASQDSTALTAFSGVEAAADWPEASGQQGGLGQTGGSQGSSLSDLDNRGSDSLIPSGSGMLQCPLVGIHTPDRYTHTVAVPASSALCFCRISYAVFTSVVRQMRATESATTSLAKTYGTLHVVK